MRASIELPFYKLQGTGNDFIFFHSDRQTPFDLEIKRTLSRSVNALCDRHFGIGADGLVILSHQSPDSVSWDFWNADGSEAEMCGNAARCAFSLLYQLGWIARSATLHTKSGPVQGEIFPDREVQVLVPSQSSGKVLTAEGCEGFFLNTGVPHFVLEESLVTGLSQKEFCARIRRSSVFGLGGTNVTLVSSPREGAVSAKTYERGVEDFTLSCGTGALAAGVWAMQRSAQSSIVVAMPGGALTVGQRSEKLSLKGPAKIVFNGTLNPGVLA